ncbi:hypothetical protein BDV3_006130 [Batrachochytrium dendrobatidis]|uniref:Nucleotide exchange factor Fes1 domain-containing protein n=1 Tax=Batrachochytrium dendrobatidis (strain JEL423) TaxID=403673 RepID=A0A177WPC1_BATDL|nr:hypothetical protein BDEG_24916 [Batrachochytrium dendrobatidis JEL423]OAJ41291.1 hypothetical protein, variant 1 [Batrachochytrium dendrobatidis JEL423]
MTGQRNITQAELLQWSVINSTTETEDAPATSNQNAPARTEPIDSKWIDLILGKGDAVRMKECVEAALDESRTEQVRVLACDELELLVESLDNANDLKSLKLWQPIISLLSSDLAQLRMYGAWVLGTAVQNNPKSQKDFMDAGGIAPILNLLETDKDDTVRTKAFYCISGAIKHNKQVFEAFYARNGFKAVLTTLQNADMSLLRRAVFFWRALLLDHGGDETHADTTVSDLTAAAISEFAVISMVIQMIESGDLDLIEKCLQLLETVLTVCPTSADADSLHAIKGKFYSLTEQRLAELEKDKEDVGEARLLLQKLACTASSLIQ